MSHNFKNNDYNIGHSWKMKILDNELEPGPWWKPLYI